MGTKHDLLTERDVESYSPRSRALAELDGCVRRFGVAARGLRVLDFGCGRGITVAKLLKMGFDAYGVDTDPEPITNGSRLFIACGYNPDQRLIRIDTDRLMPFPDGFFHVVLSDQVIEHVRNLDFLAAELARVTAPSGRGLHVFPAKWCIFEPHLFLPCIHWLPKNSLRFLYLRLMLKYVPLWQELEHKTAADRAFTYYTYSIQKTYYRPARLIRQILRSHGLEVEFHMDRHPRQIVRFAMPGRLLRWHSNTFYEVVMTTNRLSALSAV